MFCFCLLCVSFLVGNVVIPEHVSCFLPEREICFYRIIALSENLFTILDIIQKILIALQNYEIYMATTNNSKIFFVQKQSLDND